MTDRDRLNFAIAYLGGALDEPQAAAVRAKLEAGDPAWVGAAAEAREVLARLSATAEPVAPRPDAKRRLMANLPPRRWVEPTGAPAEPVPEPIRLPTSPPPASRDAGRVWKALTWVAAAACVGAIAWGGFLRVRVGQLEEKTRLADQRAADAAQKAQRDLAEADRIFLSPEARMTSLAPAAGASDRRFGRVFVAPDQRKVRVYLFDLVAPPRGRTYQLWLLPEGGGAPIPAPTFVVAPDGKAVVEADIPAGVSAVAGAAVSEEPAGGSKTVPTDVKLISKAI